jgi:type I restriction enzyme S subunit
MTFYVDKNYWTRVVFGDVVANVNQTTNNPMSDGINKYVGLDHLQSGELKVNRFGDIADGVTFTKIVSPGQTLFGKRRAYQRKVAFSDFKAICSGDILTFAPKGETLLNDYLPFLVMSEGFFKKALSTSAGSLSPRTRWSDLAKFEFLLPPLEQQKKIANLLWLIDNHKRNLQNLILDLEQLRNLFIESTFNMGTNVLGKSVKSSMSLGECAIVLRGETITKKEVSHGDVPVVAGGMNPAYFHNVSNRTGKCITISASGANAGYINTWDMPIWASDCTTVQAKVPSEFSFDYIHTFLISQQETIYKRLRKGSAQPHVYSSDIERLQIPIFDQNEQRAITAVNSRYSAANAGIEHEILALSVLFASILDSIFGEE